MDRHAVTFFAMVITAIAAAMMPDLRSSLPPIGKMQATEFFLLTYSYLAQGVFAAGFGILFLVRIRKTSPMTPPERILSIEEAARRIR